MEMTKKEHAEAAETIGLRALAWVMSDSRLAPRLLGLTGLDPAGLRARAGEAATLSAVIAFLEQHEPDLTACAEALDITPRELVRAGEILSQ